MRKRGVRLAALLLAAMTGAAAMTACGNTAQEPAKETAGTETPAAETREAETETEAEETADAAEDAFAGETPAAEPEAEPEIEQFTWLIDTAPATTMYGEYEENPIYQYWADMVWDVDGTPNKIEVDFSAPPAGAEKDNINTLIATQEYPDVMSLSHSSAGAAELYEDGIALDLTEYVEKYMPNYKAWMEANPGYASLMTNHVDGEDRFLQLFTVSDQPAEMWGGFDYRRDWIVKYGKNPETGKAFTGEWVSTDNGDDWVDDVVFPSGNPDPITITDWEWMLDIFATALEEQGITDGYPMSLPYQGAYLTGDLASGFGAPALWYRDEDGIVRFGGNTDSYRAYLECMNAWYEKGWIDPAFDERSGDIFFHVDDTSKYAGKVGLWYGVSSQMGNVMDVSGGDESNPTSGMVVFGAPQPINDKYGTKDDQGKDPFVYFSNSLLGFSVVVTEKAKDKDLATLLTAIDYLYSQEGGLLRTYGFSDEMQADLQNEFYAGHHLDNGTYHIEEDEDGNEIYMIHNERDAEDDLAQSAMMGRVLGLDVQKNVDRGYPSFKKNGVDLWVKYPAYGYLTGAVTGQLSAEDAQLNSDINTQVMTFTAQRMADFVAGRADIESDSDWESYCSELEGYSVQAYADRLNAALGNE